MQEMKTRRLGRTDVTLTEVGLGGVGVGELFERVSEDQAQVTLQAAWEGAYYAYAPAPSDVLEKTRRIEAVCRRHNVPLAAAALQFFLAHPSVAAIIPGAVKREQVESNMSLLRQPIPGEVWSELKAAGLLREDAPTP